MSKKKTEEAVRALVALVTTHAAEIGNGHFELPTLGMEFVAQDGRARLCWQSFTLEVQRARRRVNLTWESYFDAIRRIETAA